MKNREILARLIQIVITTKRLYRAFFYRVNGIIDRTIKKHCSETFTARPGDYIEQIYRMQSKLETFPEAVIFNLCFPSQSTENYPKHLLII